MSQLNLSAPIAKKQKKAIYDRLYRLRPDRIASEIRREYKRSWMRNRNPWDYPTAIFNVLRLNARRRGFPFVMVEQEFSKWLSEQTKKCHYCGLSAENAHRNFNQRLNIDRKDNSKFYDTNNIVLACKRCNGVKGQWLTYEEMQKVVEVLGWK